MAGTFVTEAIRARYPDTFILNVVVWPYDAGEVCVQHYNAALTLSHLATASDAVLVLENEVATHVCRKLLHMPSPSYRDLNAVIVRSLCMLLLPAAHKGGSLGAADDGSRDVGAVEDPLLASLAHLCRHSVR
jgi:tubulin delta